MSAHRAIEALLQKRAAALMTRDKPAFMSTVAHLSPAFARRQSHLFDWMKDVPLASYRLVASWSEYGDLARPVDAARYPGATAVTIPDTQERYRLRGERGPPASEDLYYTYVEVGGQWLVAEDRDVEDIGFDTTRHLWDFGPVVTERLGRFLLLRHPCRGGRGCARLPAGIGDLFSAAIARVRRYWPGPIPRPIPVVVPDTEDELRRMLQATFDLSHFVSFAYSTQEDARHGLRYTGARVVLNWRALASRSSSSTVAVLAHELLHVVTRSSSGPAVPLFLEEGFADYVGNDASPASLSFFDSEVAAGAVGGALPQDFQFTTGSGTDIFLSYQEAQSAVGFFVAHWGLQAFERFYRMLGRSRVTYGTTPFRVSEALRRTIGIGLHPFQQAWAGSLGL